MITYESICDKLGFDVKQYFSEKHEYKDTDVIDDGPGIFSKLSIDEMLFIEENVLKPMKK